MTGIQWTGDNADEMFHYAGKERAVVLVCADGDTMRNNYDETTSIVPVLHVGDWLYREAGGVFAVPNDSRWALDSLTRRADADKRFRDDYYRMAMREGEPHVHPFYTHGRYGYGDKVTWQGKPALVIGNSDDDTYIINVLDPGAVYSHSNYSHISSVDLTPGWPATDGAAPDIETTTDYAFGDKVTRNGQKAIVVGHELFGESPRYHLRVLNYNQDRWYGSVDSAFPAPGHELTPGWAA